MWLEQMAWVWFPIVCVFVAWTTWRLIKVGHQLRGLSERLDKIEDQRIDRPAAEAIAKTAENSAWKNHAA
ncbi:MAG TPA: hypothetical protein VJX23_02340 [Candidatus Binataceae bacterium]|nr:hypothetical protein [Candidatus Binataceae bacterium]